MKILHVTPYYAPAWSYGGVVRAVSGLAAAQAARGHHVSVLTMDVTTDLADVLPVHEILDGVSVTRCKTLIPALRRFNLSSPSPRTFRSKFRHLAAAADVIHVHELRTIENLLINPSKPVVLSPHGTLSYEAGRSAVKRGWDGLFGRYLLRKIAYIAALTQAEVAEAQALWQHIGVRFPGASIIPNGVAADFAASITPDLGIALRQRYQLGDGPVVLFLGRLHERKGLQFLIPAFAQITADYPTARLLIVGPDEGMLATAQRLAQPVADRVIFSGTLTGKDRLAALATADIFVLPAIGEGLSVAALEAMAAGLPLILTPGCNLPDLQTRKAGLLIEREIAPISATLADMLRDPDLRRAMGANGRAWVNESFTWPTIAAQTEQVYAQLTVNRAG